MPNAKLAKVKFRLSLYIWISLSDIYIYIYNGNMMEIQKSRFADIQFWEFDRSEPGR